MRKLLCIAFFCLLLTSAHSQQNYWQQEVNYNITVSLDDKENSLDGFEKIEYINNSPDTLHFIWFHLWPNAYKNDKTIFSDQLLENGSIKFYFSNKEQKGYINRLDFKADNITADIEDHPQHIDIVKVILPVPLAPGQKTIITTPFHVKLPYNFSRGGHEGQSYQATQWYPKPAVYDKNGWHAMPYLDQGEFYSEFGKFDVSITVPQNYVVAATGELQNTDEKEWLKTRSTFSWEPVKQKEKLKSGEIKTTTQLFPESAKETKTLRFTQDNIHDFAWFADKRFVVKHDTIQLSSGRVIDVFAYYTRPDYTAWQNAVQSGKDAIHHYSNLVGEYPYNIVSIVQGPESFGGGMEYPTITVISQTANVKSLDKTIIHEVGHNWFYGILASNERDHPWMDEGVNSYYEAKYAENKYGQEPQLERILFETKAVTKADQPFDLSSEKYSEINYGLSVYYKTAEWLRYLEEKIGTDLFNKAMQDYFRRWKFRHPYPGDFKKIFEEVTNRNLDSIFQYQTIPGILPSQQRSGTRTVFAYDIKSLKNYANNPTKNLLIISPAFGVNSYDKLMAGVLFTNIKFPPSALQFLATPMYSKGAKKIVGLGKIFYSLYPKGIFRRVDIGVNGSTFTMDKFTNSLGETSYLGFYKIVPTLRLTVREKDQRSSLYKYLQFKSFYFGEDELRFYRDTIINGMDTTIENRNYTARENRTLNQLKLVIENNRVLYPYQGELNIEQGKDFVRTAFTGNYFFNYPKAGGLDVRLFAGKFFYTGSKTISKQFETSRYHLNMTGANGYEDYSYSDYFIGRNKFEGFASQQIMIRDGAFKVRTDLLADKVGKTDNWLIAANFSSTIPESINPLSLLPVKIPIKFFFDIGTYAETWKQGAETDRFLYDAGLQIPLLEGLVNIYIPLIYSSVYKNYIQSTIIKKERFWKKISFSINISSFNFRKIGRNFSF